MTAVPTEVAPIIVTALFGRQDTAFFDSMRREHFPPERNQLPAHLTLFHAVAPSAERELRDLYGQLSASHGRLQGVQELMRDLGGAPDLGAVLEKALVETGADAAWGRPILPRSVPGCGWPGPPWRRAWS